MEKEFERAESPVSYIAQGNALGKHSNIADALQVQKYHHTQSVSRRW